MKWIFGRAAALLVTSAICGAAHAQNLHHGAPNYSPELYATAPNEGNFTRMFPLETWGLNPHPSPRYDLLRLGAADGPMNEDNWDVPVEHSQIEAGITFLGQFVDHDITLDLTSSLDERAVPDATENFRTPDLDLDCVYGDGPEGSPWLYVPNTPYLVTGEAEPGTAGPGGRFDLARSSAGVALIGDPRNDENMIVAQIQTAFIAFHNKVAKKHLDSKVQELGAESFEALEAAVRARVRAEAFEEARDDVIHYYHRILVEYFLPKVIGVTRTVDLVANGRRFYMPELRVEKEGDLILQRPQMPVEFSAAAFRFGHSQVRDEYVLHKGGEPKELFSPEMLGFKPLTEEKFIDYAMFFPLPAKTKTEGMPPRTAPEDKYQSARKIDPRLPDILFKLGTVNVTPPNALGTLAGRNLLRGRSFRLPAGEDLFEIVGGSASLLTQDVDLLLAQKETPDPSADGEGVLAQASAAGAKELYLQRSMLVPALSDESDQDKADMVKELVSPLRKAPAEVQEHLVLEKTPLWYYVLHESQNWSVTFQATSDTHHVWPSEAVVQQSVAYLPELFAASAANAESAPLPGPEDTGQILGPVGGTIVGEVILGLLDHYREKTNKGLDHRPHLTADEMGLTEYFGFGERMTFGDLIAYIEWDGERTPPAE